MSKLELVKEGHPALVTMSDPVQDIASEEFQEFIRNLIETSIDIGGYGLAAPQVGVNKQIFVYRKSRTGDKYKTVINPKIVVRSGKIVSRGEGCLSHPGFRRDVRRSKTFILEAQDEFGKTIRLKPTNKMEAIILQHEYDHLMGLTIALGG